MRLEGQTPVTDTSMAETQKACRFEMPEHVDDGGVVTIADGDGIPAPAIAPFSGNQLQGLTSLFEGRTASQPNQFGGAKEAVALAKSIASALPIGDAGSAEMSAFQNLAGSGRVNLDDKTARVELYDAASQLIQSANPPVSAEARSQLESLLGHLETLHQAVTTGSEGLAAEVIAKNGGLAVSLEANEAGKAAIKELSIAAAGGTATPALAKFLNEHDVQIRDGRLRGPDGEPLGKTALMDLAASYLDQKKNEFLATKTEFTATVNRFKDSPNHKEAIAAQSVQDMVDGNFAPGSLESIVSLHLKSATIGGSVSVSSSVTNPSGIKPFETAPVMTKVAATTMMMNDFMNAVKNNKLRPQDLNDMPSETQAFAKDLIDSGNLVVTDQGFYAWKAPIATVEKMMTTLEVLSAPSSEAGRQLLAAYAAYVSAEAALTALGIDPDTVVMAPTADTAPMTRRVSATATGDTDDQLTDAQLFRQAMERLGRGDDTTKAVGHAFRDLDTSRSAAAKHKTSGTSDLISRLARHHLEESQKRDAKLTDKGRSEALNRLTEQRKAAEADRHASKP